MNDYLAALRRELLPSRYGRLRLLPRYLWREWLPPRFHYYVTCRLLGHERIIDGYVICARHYWWRDEA